MRRTRTMFLVAFLVLAIAGCGKKEAAPPAGQAGGQQAAQTQGQGGGSPQDLAQGLQQLAQQVQQLQKGPDGKAYEPVDYTALQALFPDLAGWQKGEMSGERMMSPFAHSTAKVDYTKGDASLNVEIVDSAFNQAALLPFQFLMAANFSRQTAGGYEKSVRFAGQPGVEKWNKDDKSGEINLIVSGRYIVNIKGEGLADPSAVNELAGKLDIGKLAAMK